MGYRATGLIEHEYYHIYNRGNNKQIIYVDADDHVRFQDLLYICNNNSSVSYKDAKKRLGGIFDHEQDAPLVAIGAYCLMPNHFHIVLTPLVPDGVTLFMQKISTAYVMYFNKKYNRTGVLFEGRFKSKHVDTDAYLKYLFSYVHLNPTPISKIPRPGLGIDGIDIPIEKIGKNSKQQAYQTALTYPYSSFIDYVDGNRDQAMILQPDRFPQYFETQEQWKEELFEWLSYREDKEEKVKVKN